MWGDKVVLFLTSNLGGYKKVDGKPVTTNMNNINGFVDDVKSELKSIKNINFCFFCSSPDKFDKTDMYASSVKQSFELDGFTFKNYYVVDYRFNQNIEDVVNNCDIVFLCGGHVSTQNKFFMDIKLNEILKTYKGVVIGQSAGSMNSATIVYDQPVTVEEFYDKNFKKQYNGLGLTNISIMPHINFAKEESLEGVTTYQMCLEDSKHIYHYGLVDYAYIKCKNNTAVAYGKTTLFKDGKEYLLCDTKQNIELNDSYSFDLNNLLELY